MRTPFLLLALALLAACPTPNRTSSDETKNSPPKTTTATGNPQAVPENSTAMNPVAPPQTQLKASQPGPAAAAPDVHVQLTEYTIEMPDTLTAGAHLLTIANAGKVNHNFAIEGPGVSQKLASDLTRGDSAPMSVTLQKGTYTVYCPVDGHRGKGMSRTITVQ